MDTISCEEKSCPAMEREVAQLSKHMKENCCMKRGAVIVERFQVAVWLLMRKEVVVMVLPSVHSNGWGHRPVKIDVGLWFWKKKSVAWREWQAPSQSRVKNIGDPWFWNVELSFHWSLWGISLWIEVCRCMILQAVWSKRNHMCVSTMMLKQGSPSSWLHKKP